MRLAGAGLVVLFGVQAVINMAVNLNLIPAKGMTLPFISYGGSSMVAVAFGMGLLLALTRRGPEPRRIVRRGHRHAAAGAEAGRRTGDRRWRGIVTAGRRRHRRASVPGPGAGAGAEARGWRVHLATDHRVEAYGQDFPAEAIHLIASATLTRAPVAFATGAAAPRRRLPAGARR